MMLALLGIMVVLAIRGFALDGAADGLKFYLVPNFDAFKTPGDVFNVIVAAMNQAFFTLSLGIGSMAIFGSFIGKDRTLMGEGINVAILDTSVAIMSGLIIFPACFTYDVEVSAGPSLIFQTLPHVFNNMWGGRVFGSLFFMFMSFAALSTVLAVFQNILSCTEELFGWSKKKACLIDGIAIFMLSIPCILGFNLLSSFQPLGAGSGVLDLEDYIVSNILLPLGALIIVLFCTTKKGWGWDNFVAEANTGKGFKVKKWMRLYMKYVLPIIIGAILIIGVISPFTELI
jgi:NSS family neurotransmitter:Na+ symporter